MSVVKLSNGGALLEERRSFPDPDIIIRVVFRVEDIKYLNPRSASGVSSVVYFYDERDYMNSLTHYTGETSETPFARFRNTHSKKAWLQDIKYPLIGMAESLGTPWDIETRKTIESLCAYRMKELGFSVVNAETHNWAHGVSIPPTVNGAYADSVAKLLVEHQIAVLGLAGTDVRTIARRLGTLEEATELTHEEVATTDAAETEFIVQNPTHLKTEEKFDILIKAGLLRIGEPLYLTHRLVDKTVMLRSPMEVEYRDAMYLPREAIKAIAHEIFTSGVTQKQAEGWNGYNALTCLAVERNNEKIKIEALWNSVKHRVAGYKTEEPDVVDEEWLNLVLTSELVGAALICNNREAVIGEKARIMIDDKTFLSLTEFGEYVDGLNDNGWGDFKIRHQGEIYTIQSD